MRAMLAGLPAGRAVKIHKTSQIEKIGVAMYGALSP
jgi:hypothetical protein